MPLTTNSTSSLNDTLAQSSAGAFSMDVNFPGELQLLVGPPNFAPATGMESSEPQQQYAAEIAQAHANRLALGKQLKSGKGTDAAYKRHIKAYKIFFKDHHPTVNPHPIVPFKAALFLEYKRKRNKRNSKGQEKNGTSLGKEHISQVINSLQDYMSNHEHEPLYANEPLTHNILQHSRLVSMYEDFAKSNSHKRKEDAHLLKAQGTSGDTYTTTELIDMAMWCMRAFGPSNSQIHLGLRDRAMLLLSSNTAFRGDSTRHVLWSDLFGKSQPMPTIADNIRKKTLGFYQL